MSTTTYIIPDSEQLFNLMIPKLREFFNSELKKVRESSLTGGRKQYPSEVSKIYYEEGNIRVEIDLNVIAASIENGRRSGKQPPVSEIKKWVQIKHIVPRNKCTIDLLSYLIARKIGKQGTRGKFYLYNIIKDGELPDIGDILDQYFESYSMLEKLS